ncbi:hypothetical protein [Halobacillus sp. A5]|uniref:hypothetical protein n=1 Tax=Halobacillus sp. A5 TaxID=2880263 RepID=UPI0020A69F22|nr:hypothetical protein [Halobacillus sp. A5]MCP3029480.1 hypothetical protein [Halobacillus sp. A5]
MLLGIFEDDRIIRQIFFGGIYIFKKGLVIGIIGLLLVFFTTMPVSALSQILVIGPEPGVDDVGPEFTTTETVSRSEVVDFHDDVEYAEAREDDLNSLRYALASAAVTHPITKSLGKTLTAAGASQIVSSLILNRGLASENIQDVLNSSTANEFDVSIKYEKKTRGQDKWYEPAAMSINPA